MLPPTQSTSIVASERERGLFSEHSSIDYDFAWAGFIGNKLGGQLPLKGIAGKGIQLPKFEVDHAALYSERGLVTGQGKSAFPVGEIQLHIAYLSHTALEFLSRRTRGASLLYQALHFGDNRFQNCDVFTSKLSQ